MITNEDVNVNEEATLEVTKEEVLEVKEVQVPENIKVAENEVYIDGKGIVKIKPTKLKYFIDNSYNNFMLIKEWGINEVCKFEDGVSYIKKFLGAVLDVDSETIDFIPDMTTKTLIEIIEKANKINEIKETDFLKKLQEMGITKESPSGKDAL